MSNIGNRNQNAPQNDDGEIDRLVNQCVDSVFRKYNRRGDGRMTKEETL